MISSVSLGNIRVFRGKESNFSFGDLCVFCGTNSSGKSSVLKSILLLRQSQGIDEPVRARNGLLRFVGTQVDLGKFATFVSDRRTDAEITISITVPDPINKDHIRFLRSLLTDSSQSPEEQRIAEKPSCSLDVRFTFAGTPTRFQDSVSTAGFGQNTAQLQGVLNTAAFTLKTPTETLLTWFVYKADDSRTEGPSYVIRLPNKYFEKVGGRRIMDVDPSSDPECIQLSVVLDGLLPARLFARIHQEKDKQEKVPTDAKDRWNIYPLPPHIDAAIKSLTTALTRIHYLGPLRAPAKRYYVTSSDSLPLMDPAGEFLPYLLALEDEPKVMFIPPRQKKPQKLGLFTALDHWLYFIRTGETKPMQEHQPHEVRASSMKGVLVELEVPSPNDATLHSLADSGFGYSQLLPILVRGLMAMRKDTMIVEQPELHLNPGVQIRLAEFFVSLVLAGKQVLLETHSEHMVNAIRVLVAEQDEGNLAGRCNIFYIRACGDGPQVQPLSIDANGSVPEWPYEFFGEAANLAGRLLRAQKKFRDMSKDKE
jgi:hypothetical protein